MAVINILLVVSLILIFIYFVFQNEIKNISLRNKIHNCIRCGESCRHLVNLSKVEKDRILDQGYQEEEVVEKKLSFYFLKRKENGECIFLQKSDDSLATCSIYEFRPYTCRQFPKVKYGWLKGYDHRCRGLK